MLKLSDLSYSYPESSEPAFQNVSMNVEEGQLLLIQGESGCGKSSLLKRIFGLIPKLYGGKVSGAVTSFLDGSTTMGYLPQCPEDRFICDLVEEEALLALHLAGYSPMDAVERWRNLSDSVGMDPLRHRQIQTLSGGERKKLALVLALIHQPKILLLDEPLNQLDADERSRFVRLILDLKKSRALAVIVADHQVEYWQDHADRIYDFSNESPTQGQPLLRGDRASSRVLVRLEDISFRYGTKNVLQELHAEIRSHEILALVGRNGSGKSTLLKLISGQLEPFSGRMRFVDNLQKAYLPQHPSDFFLAQTVMEEFHLAAKLKRKQRQDVLVDENIRAFELKGLLNKNPHDLSVGQQQRVALAALFSTAPDLLLLDEPTHGLDTRSKWVLQHRLLEQANQGMGILLVTHDSAFSQAVMDRSLGL